MIHLYDARKLPDIYPKSAREINFPLAQWGCSPPYPDIPACTPLVLCGPFSQMIYDNFYEWQLRTFIVTKILTLIENVDIMSVFYSMFRWCSIVGKLWKSLLEHFWAQVTEWLGVLYWYHKLHNWSGATYLFFSMTII